MIQSESTTASEIGNKQLDALRRELHAAVDEVLDHFLERAGLTKEGVQADPGVVASPLEVTGEWTYRWPGGAEEVFYKGRWFELLGTDGAHRVRVAWTRRAAWGRDDRVRAVVFHQVGSVDSTTYYPWTEFVETDDGRYAAPIPDPDRPRAMLADLDDLPPRFAGMVVERSDQVFTSIAEGPSLRLVVGKSDEAAMVEHGYWVGVLRNRI